MDTIQTGHLTSGNRLAHAALSRTIERALTEIVSLDAAMRHLGINLTDYTTKQLDEIITAAQTEKRRRWLEGMPSQIAKAEKGAE